MQLFDMAALLLGLAAIFGYLNHRIFKMPHTIGLMVITLVLSGALILLDSILPGLQIKDRVVSYLGQVDFSETLMQGMLCFLLFAGALHINLEELLQRKWTIGLLATLGVMLSTAIVGFASFYLFRAFGLELPLGPCLVFGALISPTDPVAVMGLLKTAGAPKSLEAKIAGESLFNDGVGVVVFTVLVVIFLGGGHGADGSHAEMDAVDVGLLFLQEVVGGAVLGLVLGFLAYRAMKSIDEYSLEVILSLALVMGAYALASRFHLSGPIAVVVAGLLIGNKGKQMAMSLVTVDHMEKFWALLDEILNSILFLLIGLEVFLIPLGSARLVEAGLLAIPLVILARFISVSVPISVLKLKRKFSPGVIPILTWAGLRGGISVALVLSLPRFEGREALVVATYLVVLFSVIIQGLTVKPLLTYIRTRYK